MDTRSTEPRSLADAARHVADHATTLVRLEVALALREVRRKGKRLVGAAAMLTGAAVFGWFVLMTGIAAAIAAIALVLPAWAALLIACGGLLLLSGLLGTAGLLLVRRAVPPVPEQAIEEARLTTEALKNGHH